MGWLLARQRALGQVQALELEKARLEERAARVEELEKVRQQLDEELRTYREKAAGLDAQLAEMQKRADELGRQTDELQEKYSEAKARIAELTTSLEEERKRLEEQEAFLEQAEEQLRDAFKALSQEALDKTNERFLQLAEQKLGTTKVEIGKVVEPLQERLQKLTDFSQELDRRREKAYAELGEYLKALKTQTDDLKTATVTLVRALQDPGQVGDWGELALQKVVELAGLTEHVDYVTQEGTADGRPDMIVRLPGEREVVIDAKTPMKAYLQAVEAHDPAERRRLLEVFVRNLREQARQLSRRDYVRRSSALDLTVLFLASEAAYRAALEQAPTLIEEVLREHNVVIATPTLLLGFLRAVAYGWRQERLARDVEQVRKEAGKVYDALHNLADHYARLGRSLKSTVDNFNKMGGTIEGRLLPAARKFKDMGLGSGEELPQGEPIDTHPRALVRGELVESTRPQAEEAQILDDFDPFADE